MSYDNGPSAPSPPNDQDSEYVPVADAKLVGVVRPAGGYQPLGDAPAAARVDARPRYIATRSAWAVTGIVIMLLQLLWLVMPRLYSNIVIPCLIVTTGAAIWYPHKGTARVVVAFHAGLVISNLLMAIAFTIDYNQKCSKKMDLWERQFRLARNYNCEFDIIAIYLWIAAAVVFEAIFICYCAVLFAYFKSNAPAPEPPLPCDRDVDASDAPAGFAQNNRFSMLFFFGLACFGAAVPLGAGVAATFTGTYDTFVDGKCPGDPRPQGILATPRHNDLGCCSYYNAQGVCGDQTACADRSLYLSAEGTSDDCGDLRGLLSCSVMRHTSGYFANFSGLDYVDGYPNQAIKVCGGFCQQLYAVCQKNAKKNDPETRKALTENALNWCQGSVDVRVQNDSLVGEQQFCFNSALRPSRRGIMAGILAVIAVTVAVYQ